MQEEIGLKSFPIWLLGDSEPERWKDNLDFPLDDRHPIRHNIWTSIMDKVQDRLYREKKARIDAQKIYIRNAVRNPQTKPHNNAENWDENRELNKAISDYNELITEFNPKLIISFGAFAFEFCRRCMYMSPSYRFRHWGAKEMGDEFRKWCDSSQNIILLPLLHRSIAGGNFLQSHRYYCASEDPDDSGKSNYFNYVAGHLFSIIKDWGEIMIDTNNP